MSRRAHERVHSPPSQPVALCTPILNDVPRAPCRLLALPPPPVSLPQRKSPAATLSPPDLLMGAVARCSDVMCDVDVRRCSRELIPAVVRRPPSIPTDAAAGQEKSPQRGHHLEIVRYGRWSRCWCASAGWCCRWFGRPPTETVKMKQCRKRDLWCNDKNDFAACVTFDL